MPNLRDAMIIAPSPLQQRHIRVVLEQRGHGSHTFSDVSGCEMMLQSATQINLLVVAIVPSEDPMKPVREAFAQLQRLRPGIIPTVIVAAFAFDPLSEAKIQIEARQFGCHFAGSLPDMYSELIREVETANIQFAIGQGKIRVDIEHT